jgi:hypothetical protein
MVGRSGVFRKVQGAPSFARGKKKATGASGAGENLKISNYFSKRD